MTTGYAASCPLVRAYCLSAFGCSSGTFGKQNAAFLVCKALGETKSIRKWHLSQVSYYQSENATRFPRPNVSIAFSISQKVKINISSGPLRPCYPEAVATSRLPGFMQKLVRNTWSHAAWSHWKKYVEKMWNKHEQTASQNLEIRLV